MRQFPNLGVAGECPRCWPWSQSFLLVPAMCLGGVFGLRRRQNQDESVDDFSNRETLWNDDESRTRRRPDEVPEVPWHRRVVIEVGVRLKADGHQRTSGMCFLASVSFW